MSTMSKNRNSAGGFSLIEVLIAVLVLATGMLALAALQSTLVRNSVDAKNRSQAMSIAVDMIERIRQNSGASISDYNNLQVGQTSWAAWSAPGGYAGAGANYGATYESRQTVQRYVRDSNPAACGGAANVPCFRLATADDGPSAGVAEFKRIDVEVRWTDAQGNVRAVTTSDIVGTTTDDKTDAILDQTGKPSVGIGEPVSRISKPSEAGIIPIAVGDGKETAASNPKPITGRERGRTDETQFQVLTYSVEDGDVARLNRVVDTRVIGCRCNLQTASTVVDKTRLDGIPVQATFWDGLQYAEPEAVANVLEGERGAPVETAVQSQLCQTCCLDHHDRTSNTVDFDPFRSQERQEEFPHEHYFDPDENDELIEFERATAGKDYFEVCRMIRVNGIFRVATDMRLDLMNMLETDPLANESLPLASKIPRYQAAVKDFIKQRVVDNVATPDMAAFADVFVEPDLIKMETDSLRYMHNRGLYIDYLETPARTALTNALAECPDGKPKVDCALAVLPFVSINTTDIAQWSSENAESSNPADRHITVTNWALRPDCPRNDPTCSLPPPARGATTAIAGGEEAVLVQMQVSNSGVSDSFPIDPQDANLSPYSGQIATDAQEVLVDSSCPSVTQGTFKVNLLGTNFVIPELLQQLVWENTMADSSSCSVDRRGVCPGATKGGTAPNPFSCATGFALPPKPGEVDLQIQLAGYNRTIPPTSTPRADLVSVSCSSKKVGQYMCENWKVSSVKVGGQDAAQSIAYSNDGFYAIDANNPGEGARIDLKHAFMVEGAAVDVSFTLESVKKMGASCDTLGNVIQPPCPLTP